MPKSCEDDECYMAVHEGKCGDLDDKYHKDDDEEIWDEEYTGFSTNKHGRAAGTLFDLESGYDYDDNKCKAMVIYGPEDDSSDGDVEVIGCGMLVPEDEDDYDDYCEDYSRR